MYQKGPFIFLRLIAFLVMLGLLVGGGYLVYHAGYSAGLAQAPAVAKAIQEAATNNQVPAVAPMYGYPYPYGYYPYPHFGFFPFGSIFGTLFFLFVFFGLMRMVFFRGMGWGHHGYGHWHRGPDGKDWGGPPWMRHEHDEKAGEAKDEAPQEKK